jgi:hypothetical protein
MEKMHFVGPFMLKMTIPLLMGRKPQIMCSMFCHTNFVLLIQEQKKGTKLYHIIKINKKH